MGSPSQSITIINVAGHETSATIILCTTWVLLGILTVLSGDRGAFRALLNVGHAGGTPVHNGASLGPGRPVCRMLWAFKVMKLGK